MDLPVNDELGLVLQASEMTAAAPAVAPEEKVVTQLRQPKGDEEFKYAMQNSVLNLEEAYNALRPNMARKFPFELDTFQKEGVVLMEAGENVFVAAHTSAGRLLLSLFRVGSSCSRPTSVGPICISLAICHISSVLAN
jgi:antiviral helicase SKI2